MSLTIGSLFSGIGGLELGLERAGLGPVLWQVERDEWCRAVLAKHWPQADRSVTDVCDATAATLPRVGIMCGGFPCQDVSAAGRGGGVREGERSGLWRQFARLIGELRPPFVVVENVALLRSRGLDVVLGDLASCGYDATWDCVPAAAVGAPHRRDRLFVVAWRVPDADAHTVRLGPERDEGWPSVQQREDAESEHVGAVVAEPVGDGLERVQQGRPATRAAVGSGLALAHRDALRRARLAETWAHAVSSSRDDAARRGQWPPGPADDRGWEAYVASGGPEPAVRRGLDGASRGLDRRRLAALGNAVVPQVAEAVGRVVMALYENEATR